MSHDGPERPAGGAHGQAADKFKIGPCGIFDPRKQIEGYDAVAREEAEGRNDGMLGLCESICGLPVRPLTFRHLLWLDIYQSVFLMKMDPAVLARLPDIHLHVARFMWVLSPGWRPYSRVRKWLFYRRYKRVLYGRRAKMPGSTSGKMPAATTNTERIVKEIAAFMDGSTWDLLADAGRNNRKSYFSGAAAIVNALCEAYGGLNPNPAGPNAAIDMPLRMVGQLLRARIRAENPKALMSNLTDKLEQDWLAEVNRQLKQN